MQCDSTKLVALARANDREALDALTRCFGDRLIAVGRRACRSDVEAEDAVQDALLGAVTHLDAYRGDGPLEAWVVRLVTRACGRLRRGQKNQPAEDLDVLALASDTADPERAAAMGERARALGEALNSLSPRDRLVLLLAEGQGWTAPEIARETGTTPTAVRARLVRARRAVRDQLGPEFEGG
jgi:RNA polymerase sigma-70 factor (ECF subfamily)